MEEEKHIEERSLKMLHERMDRHYSGKVIDYGNNPRNYGVMDEPDAHAVYTGPCGDTVEIYLRIANGKILEAKYTTDGCMTTHAAASAAMEMAIGRSIPEALTINQSSIIGFLEGLPDDSAHCALLAATTLQRAIRSYVTEKSSKTQRSGM
jgi:nitrogen fixation protein NifU and related proteins